MVAGASAQCTPLGEAASQAGLTTLVETVKGVAGQDSAAPIIGAVGATEPVENPITIFAPTNDAFQAISDVVGGLSPQELVAVLANHVVPAEANSDAIKGAIADSDSGTATFSTLSGGSLEASEDGKDLVVTPAGTEIMAKVVTADVETCAGVVHVVDMVLVPAADGDASSPEGAEACTPLGEAATEAGLTALVDAVSLVADVDGAAPILAAVSAAEPVDSPVTVFAPTNEAFEAIASVIDGLSPQEVVAVLGNHIVGKELDSAAITAAIADAAPNAAEVETLLGTTLEATLEGEDVMVSPAGTEIVAKVVTVDVQTCAGVVHVVDMVLVPAADAPLGLAPISAPVAGVYTQYPGQDYIPELATGNSTDVPIEDIGPSTGILVENAEECEAECDALEGCNAASYYIELIEDTQTNCFLKKIGEACMVPSDAIQDTNAVLSLKCPDDQAMAPIADAPLADAPGAADAPAGDDDITGGAGSRDVALEPAADVGDEGSAGAVARVGVAAAAIAAVAALL